MKLSRNRSSLAPLPFGVAVPACWRRGRLPAGHAQHAVGAAAAREPVRQGRLDVAAAGRGHRRARHAAGRRGVLHREGAAARPANALPFPLTAADPRSRRGALQHLLHAVPRPVGARRRDDRAPRLPPAAVVPRRSAAGRRRSATSTTHDQRVRRDAGLSRADLAAGSLGDRRLRARAATEPARAPPRTFRPRSGRNSRSRRPPAAPRRAQAVDGHTDSHDHRHGRHRPPAAARADRRRRPAPSSAASASSCSPTSSCRRG